MLVLSRKLDEKIEIASGDVIIQIVGINRDTVRLGITAPSDILILRGELAERQRDDEQLRRIAGGPK
jgi:carbon storage regulator